MSAPTNRNQDDDERINQLLRSLTNFSPDDSQVSRIEDIRAAAKTLGILIIKNSKNSRERSTALTKLEEAAMWAVKGIVLNG